VGEGWEGGSPQLNVIKIEVPALSQVEHFAVKISLWKKYSFPE